MAENGLPDEIGGRLTSWGMKAEYHYYTFYVTEGEDERRVSVTFELREYADPGSGYFDGMNVSDVIKAGLYDYKKGAGVITRVCSALSVLHENGFVHRDVKPENVIIANDGTVKLIDFDACRSYDSGKTADTQILGTVGYAPPEQYGIYQTDKRSDIYSVGVLLNVMLTGKHPSEYLARGKAGRIITKCTSISPELRYPDVKNLITSL